MGKQPLLLLISLFFLIKTSGQYTPDTTLPSLIPYRMGNLWGFCTPDKKMAIPAKYTWVQPFEKNRAIVYFDSNEHGRYGIIDEAGNELLRIGKDTTLTILNDGTVTAEKGFYNIVLLITPSGEIFKPARYHVSWQFGENLYVAKKGKLYGVIDRSEKVVISFRYKHIWQLDEKGYALAIKSNGQNGFIDKKGKPFFFLNDITIRLGPFENDRAIITMNTKGARLNGFIDRSGKITVPAKYNDIFFMQDDLYIAGNGNQWGVIRDNGDTVIPFRYSSLRWLAKDRLEFTDANGNGVMDMRGREFFRENKNRWFNYIGDALMVYEVAYRKGDTTGVRYGAVDISGRDALPPEYIGIWYNGPGMISVIEKNGRSYYMDFRFNKYYEE